MDNKQKIVVNYIPPEFQDIPSQEELEDLYEQFVLARGKTARKVGITIERRMKKRYYATHMYEELTEDNVFARASNSKVAVAVENMMKKILIDASDSANPFDSCPGTTVENTSYIIYMVKPKGDDSKCLICPNAFIDGVMERKKHFETVHWKEVILYNRALEQLKGQDEEENRQLIKRIERILEWTKGEDDKKADRNEPSTSSASSSSTSKPAKKFKKN